MRAFGKAASDLTKDLGLDESLRSLRRQSLSAEDAALVDEMLSYMV